MGLSDSRQGRFAGYVFPPSVGRSRSHLAGPPRLLDRSFHARCPQPPRKVRWLPLPVASPAVLSGFILVGGLATFVFLSRPNRVHLRYGSRVCLAGQPAPLLGFTPARLHAEQAIYTVNSFQFTRSARLILAYRPSGSGWSGYFMTSPKIIFARRGSAGRNAAAAPTRGVRNPSAEAPAGSSCPPGTPPPGAGDPSPDSRCAPPSPRAEKGG